MLNYCGFVLSPWSAGGNASVVGTLLCCHFKTIERIKSLDTGGSRKGNSDMEVGRMSAAKRGEK